MAESVMLCFVQGFDDPEVASSAVAGKEPKLQTVKNKFLRKSRAPVQETATVLEKQKAW
nr:unnamed protein product [Callosobruchus chinensis]